MKVALRGEKAGLWTDHATDDKGDILTLWAICHNFCIKTQFPEVVQSAASWLGISATNLKPKEAQISPQGTQQVQKIQYNYQAPDKTVIAYIYRQETEKGKTFKCFDVINQQYKAPQLRPLYNLPQITQTDTIILCEGEKCADALIKLGYCATTAMFGSNAPIDKQIFYL